ncbi:GTP-binding protein [Boletus coccyginus]|nr:GTP-binding protein [Boletus coccyginus]
MSDDSRRAAAVRKRFSRFRILVIGRANAGKTTLLQRVCKTTESPIVRDRDGIKVTAGMLSYQPTRGEHDIEHEISFKSNDQFVFHDSRGFEAGSEDELLKVQSFIKGRAKDQRLGHRLHAIWYCIPMNEHCRPITVAEEAFFSKCGTGKVPVIAIFTKFDALHTIAFGELIEQGKGMREARDMAAKHAEEIFRRNNYCGMLQDKAFPPRSFVCMTGMNEEQADCAALISSTAEALNDEMLEMLLVSAQQINLEICIKYAIKR